MKKKVKRILSGIVAAVFVFCSFPTAIFASDSGTESAYIIKTNAAYTEELRENLNGVILNDNIITDVSLSPREAKQIEKRAGVLSVEEDIILTGAAEEDVDENDGFQWNLAAMGVTDVESSDYQPKVALIDSGISYSSDITVTDSIDLVNDGNENPLFADSTGHGTAMAGIICAEDNDLGITGVNPNVDLYSAKVLDENNSAPLSRVLQAIYWAIDNDVDIINMSLGTNIESDLLHSAVAGAYNADILMVASAGNNPEAPVTFPAAYNEVIAVGASTASGEVWQETSVSSQLELLAPGDRILSTGFIDGVECSSGTSYSAAEVTGIASLLLQINPAKTSRFIRDLLNSSAKKVGDYSHVDYKYAREIYNDFELSYNPEDDSPSEFVNPSPIVDYSEDADKLIYGAWVPDRHQAQAIVVSDYVKLDSNDKPIVLYACKNVDTYYSSHSEDNAHPNSGLKGKVNALHGRGNFVANARFLSNFAQYMRQGLSLEASLDKCKSKFPSLIKKLSKAEAYEANKDNDKINENTIIYYQYVAADTETTPHNSKHLTDGQVMEQMVKAVIEIYKDLEELGSDGRLYQKNELIDSRQRMLVYLGVTLHVIGDIYAHRTIVPKSTIVDAPQYFTQNVDKFAKNDFVTATPPVSAGIIKGELKNYVNVTSPFLWLNKNGNYPNKPNYRYWDYFTSAVNWGIVEFQDVILFEDVDNIEPEEGTKAGFDTNNVDEKEAIQKYDDKMSFVKGRYEDATNCCKRYLKKIVETNLDEFTTVEKFYPKYVFPKIDGIILNNLKNYILAAGLSIENYDCASHSTDSYV